MKRKLISLMIVLALTLVAFACNEGEDGGTALAPNAVKVEFYVMSQCPFGVKVEDAVKPALDKLGKYVDFNLEYIVTEKEPGKFKSLHGENEVMGNIVQLCAKKLAPKTYMDFVACQNKTYRKVHENWKDCATQTKLDVVKLEACMNSEDGKKMLSESAKRAIARKATGSPTIFVADKPYRGGRTDADFMRAFCKEIKGDQPQVCKDLPKPVAVNLTILNDKRCDECIKMAAQIKGQLSGVFAGLDAKEIDYASDEGKKLFADAKLKNLPAFLFDESIAKDEKGHQQLKRWLAPAGTMNSLRVGAKFDPTAEICDNKKDDTGNGKIDCDDETCKANLLCRKDVPKRLDLFVMSQCPYGTRALDAMKEVLKNFGSDMDFHVNFIASKEGEGFKSLHGQPEVDENIRELCAIKHFPKDYKYMDYIWCRDKNIRSTEWAACTTQVGIKEDVMRKCFEGSEGKKLLEENIKLANAMGVSASPTWLTNNKYKFSGIDPEAIKVNFCKYNKGLKGCENTLSSSKKPVKGSCK